MRYVSRKSGVTIVAAFALVSAVIWSPSTLRAQNDDTPHPAHVHGGTCDTLGDVVAPLVDVSVDGGNAIGGNATGGNSTEGNASLGNVTDGNASNATGGNTSNATTGNATGAGNPIPAELSLTAISLSLDEMLAAPHAINVHLSAEEIGT